MDNLHNLGKKYIIPLSTETVPKMLSALGKIEHTYSTMESFQQVCV